MAEPKYRSRAAEDVRAGRRPGGLPRSVRLEASSDGYNYDLSVELMEPGRVRFELLGADHDGVRAIDLTGELPTADLAAVGELFLSAAAQIGPAVGPSEGQAPSRRGGPWTDEEKQLVAARHAAGADVASIAAELGRTERAIRFKLYDLRLGPWPDDAVRESPRQPKPPPAYTMEELRRVNANSHKKWTAEDDARLAARFAEGADIDKLMSEFGRNHNAIVSRLGHLRVQQD
jgi:transposase-like protein